MTAAGSSRVGIVGLGLIGGSLARALVERDREVVATTRSAEARRGAAGVGVEVVDDVAAVVGRADVVVLAVPLPAMPDALAAVGAALGQGGPAPTVTDVGSVKGPVLAQAAAALPDPALFVGGHPMAGTEEAGWSAATGGLFTRRRWALAVDAPTDLARWAAAAEVALATGAEVVPVEAAAHDAAVALVSHLPYALAAAAAALLDGDADAALARTLAAGSFTDLTRVAGGNPSLGVEMAVANAPAVAARLRQAQDVLDDLASALERAGAGPGGPVPESVRALFAAGHAGRADLDRSRAADADGPVHEVRLDRDGLAALGRRGGRVVGLRGPADAGGVPVRVVEPAGDGS